MVRIRRRRKQHRGRKVRYREPYALRNIITYAGVMFIFFIGGIMNGMDKKFFVMLGLMGLYLVYGIIRYIRSKNNPIAKENYEKFKAMIEEDDDFDYDAYDDVVYGETADDDEKDSDDEEIGEQ